MAMINVEDIYILDETGEQVDQVTGLYLKNENASDTEKAQARANIGAGGSNRNLLDNAYFVGGGSQLGDGIFPINQRGQTSYAAYANSIDRWYAAAAMTVAADGISCGAIVQKLPQVAPLDGKTLTFSALLADGTMLSGSAVFNSASDTYFYSNASTGEYLIYNTYFSGFEVISTRKLAAVKLEYGTVSTLANDAPPNYWLELQKCKARLRFVPLTRCPIVFASSNAYLDLNGCEMEGAPIASLYSNEGAVVGSSGVMASITSVTNIAIQHNVPLLQFNLTGTINDQVGQIFNTVVQLSSEL
jgi:hypothetical protein